MDKPIPMFRLTPSLAEEISRTAQERGISQAQVVSDILDAYANAPFPLEGETRSKHIKVGLVSEETRKVIEEQAQEAGVSMGDALYQIVELMTRNGVRT